MLITIPRIIDEQEILVRFIFEKHFKNKKIEPNRINDGEIFLDLKGVSLQRELYCDETKCKTLAKANAVQKYIGFVIFRLKNFNYTVHAHKAKRPDFEVELISSPLDVDLNIIPNEIEVTTLTPGMPAHADIKYLNPALMDDESPKIAIRKFSRNLYKNSKLIIDEEIEKETFSTCKFKNVV